MMPHEKLMSRLLDRGFGVRSEFGLYGWFTVYNKKDWNHPLNRDHKITYYGDPVQLTAEQCQAIEQDVLTTFGGK